jgi:hypothetical protein
VCWDGIEPLLISFAMTDKVEGVHGEFVSLLVVFGRPASVGATTRVFFPENSYEFLQDFYAGYFREERIDDLLRNARHECPVSMCTVGGREACESFVAVVVFKSLTSVRRGVAVRVE